MALCQPVKEEREKVCVCVCVSVGAGNLNTANEHISGFHFLQMFSGFHMSAACNSVHSV